MKNHEEREKFNEWLKEVNFSKLYVSTEFFENEKKMVIQKEPEQKEPEQKKPLSLELKNWMTTVNFSKLYVSPEVKNLPNEKFVIVDLTPNNNNDNKFLKFLKKIL